MVYMDEGLEVKTQMGAGVLSALARKFFGGESVFWNTYTARSDARLGIAPSFAGDIRKIELKQETLILQKGAYLCSTGNIQLKTRWGGMRSFFSREGFFLLEASGTGDLFFSSYGALFQKEIHGEYILDTGHLVAFEPTLDFEVQTTGGLKSTFFSGEGLTMRFKGSGSLWLQTRVRKGLVSWIMSFLPR